MGPHEVVTFLLFVSKLESRRESPSTISTFQVQKTNDFILQQTQYNLFIFSVSDPSAVMQCHQVFVKSTYPPSLGLGGVHWKRLEATRTTLN